MSDKSEKQYYLSLSHRVESAHHKDLTIQVLVRSDSPNLNQPMLNQASASAQKNAQEIMPGIEVTAISLVARIELGYMTAEEFEGTHSNAQASDAPETLQ